MKCKKCSPLKKVICSCVLHPDYQVNSDIEQIKHNVCKEFNISIGAIESKSRKQELVIIRKIAMRKCREAGATIQTIGKAFNRNHSTVLYALNN